MLSPKPTDTFNLTQATYKCALHVLNLLNLDTRLFVIFDNNMCRLPSSIY